MTKKNTDSNNRSKATGSIHDVASPHTDPVTHEDIAERAYELYVLRGRTDGHDIDDWLQAEQELRARRSSAAA